MVNTLELFRNLGKLEHQVSQLCTIFDKKMFLMRQDLDRAIKRTEELEAKITELQKDEDETIVNTRTESPEA